MSKGLAISLALALTLSGGQIVAADEDTKAAVKAADSWLAVVDKGEYKKSWDDAAAYFKQSINAPGWESALKKTRVPLGKVISRRLKSTEATTVMPGAPDGHYVIVQYKTTFEHKQSGLEKVIPMKEKDGSWKVSGYFIY